MSKRAANHKHTKMRMEERWGLEWNRARRQEVIAMIQANHTKPVKKISVNRSIHLVHYLEKDFMVVYDKLRHSLITVLPQKAREYSEIS